MAMKSTYCEIGGRPKEIFKDPKTTTTAGMVKKSLRGLIRVEQDDNGNYYALDRQTKEEEKQGCLHTVFLDGKMLNETSLENIRKTRLHYAYKAVLADNEF